MHIAVCDDNVADRKQLERLLGRECDSRKSVTGVLYTDSYGVGDHLFPKRMSYDLFFIDLQGEEQDGLSFAISLCENGVTAPIVLCPSKTDYRAHYQAMDSHFSNILFLDKPILKAQLSYILDQAISIELNQVKTIELRHEKGTLYVNEEDIIYVKAVGRYLSVQLRDGQSISILDNLPNFYQSIIMFDSYIATTSKAIVNINYLSTSLPWCVIMKDGARLPSSLRAYRWIKEALKENGNSKENSDDN